MGSGSDGSGFKPWPCTTLITKVKPLNRIKPQIFYVKWEKQWSLCLPGLVWGLNRIVQVLTYYHLFLNGGSHCGSKCHCHQYHHSSFYIYYLYHLKDFFLIKKARLLLSHQTEQFQPLSLWIKSFDIQQGKSYWVAEVYTWAPFSSGWNSSLDRPIHRHRSFQISLYTHGPINHFLPWAPCSARLAPNCLSGPPWPFHFNSESPRRSTRKQKCAWWGGVGGCHITQHNSFRTAVVMET